MGTLTSYVGAIFVGRRGDKGSTGFCWINITTVIAVMRKVDPAETRTPDPSNFRKEYEPGSNKNRIGRKSSARRSDPARLHSSRHLGWAMVGDAKSRKCKTSILQRIRSGRRGAQPTSAHSSPQPAQATHHAAHSSTLVRRTIALDGHATSELCDRQNLQA